ncbi:Protein kinase-like domain protein [Niveomyces insectorum RCEF 264]|uniref:Protein kinase-like domain protein n=1 Tax=Niveomyces insectorum RCEF 264 TaxID=1081102 RepID=A0A162JBA2_9HYPO|nr:Protein kinase-like domain protein [Niveomyces insectorum RCEF 264]
MDRELAALTHINAVIAASPRVKHVGIANVRTLLDQVTVGDAKRRRGNLCLVYKPLAMSLGDMRKANFGGRLPIDVVKGVVFYVLRGLDFLHSTANLVHADLQEDNILLSLQDETELKEVEDEEMHDPSPRKEYKDHVIYASRLPELSGRMPVICDFGEARFGQESYGEHALPDLYRAPEILLRIEWDEKLDIWTLGLVIWTMVEGTNLFTDNRGGRWKSALPHMARMISLLGPPPQDLLDTTPVTKAYFERDGRPFYLPPFESHKEKSVADLLDAAGRLKKGHVVAVTSLETEMTALDGPEKAEFLRFLRRLLQWDPDDRPSARELMKDPWLTPPKDAEGEPCG